MTERRPGWMAGALVGLLLTAPLTAVLYFMNALTGLAFAPFAAFDWVRDRLPAGVINSGIERLAGTLTALGISVREASKPAEIIMVLGTFLAAGVVAGAVFFAAARRASPSRMPKAGLIPGVIFGLPLSLIIVSGLKAPAASPALSAGWTLAAFLGWGYVFGKVYAGLDAGAGAGRREETAREAKGEASAVRTGRRKFLVALGASSAVITVAGAGLARVLARRSGAAAGGFPESAGRSIGSEIRSQVGPVILPNRDDPVKPAPGTRPEYTPLEEHYRIDINLQPPVIDGETWALRIGGLVRNPLTLTLAGLVSQYPRTSQFVTLSCISNPVGGDLIGTTLWTGVSLQKILDKLQVEEGAKFLHLESVDGFHETVPLDLIRSDGRIMFAYAWDGRPLEVEHGFPLRIYIPDRYGMKQPKWITRAEITSDDNPGYWVERGWSREARARATSVIDTVAVDDVVTSPSGDRLVPVGGIAWAGARGISRVEVRVDRGKWVAAELRGPLSPLTWVVWRFDWPFAAGRHKFTVRCRDGKGELQVETASGAFPDGATGLFELEKKV